MSSTKPESNHDKRVAEFKKKLDDNSIDLNDENTVLAYALGFISVSDYLDYWRRKDEKTK